MFDGVHISRTGGPEAKVLGIFKDKALPQDMSLLPSQDMTLLYETHEVPQAIERPQRLVQRRSAAERQRQAVAEKIMAFGERAEFPAEPAADVDPVLRRDFQKIDGCVRSFLQRAPKGPPQAKSGALDG